METIKTTIFQILKRKESLLFFVLFVTCLSLLGWIYGNILATSFSSKSIPIAPSTALLFTALCLITISKSYFEKSHVTHLAATSVIVLSVLFCFNIFFDYLFNFRWDFENIFIKNPNALGNVPTGRMSPITALLLIFICIGILSNRETNSKIIKYVGGCFSLLVFLISSVLLIGYLYKAPLLYGSEIIPVALPTAICFLLFSITLLRVFELRFWTFNLIEDNIITLQLLKSFLPVVVFAIIVQGLLITNISVKGNNPTLSVAFILFIVVAFIVFVIVKLSGSFGHKLHRAEQILKESEKEFRSLAESMPQIVWTTRADGWNTYFNQQWVNYTGLTLEESYGNGWNKPFHPDDKQRSWDAWQNAVTNQAEYSLECRLQCHDGTYHWWLVRGVPQINNDGEIVKWYGTCTDIEKIKEAELALQEDEKQLRRLNKDKDRFISILGHDLKSPFNNILGLSELLTEDIGKLKLDEIEVFANNIYKSAKTTNKLLEDILMWARSQQGNIHFNPKNLSLSETCKNILEILNPGAFAKNITIYDSSLDHINVYADSDMLKTILLNLVSNSIKFTGSGGKIIIKAEQNSENITISVSDNGVGITPENLAKLFDISEVLTTKGTAGESGTGLGLLLVKEFVEKHRGKIWVESEPGKGSEFFIALPCNKS